MLFYFRNHLSWLCKRQFYLVGLLNSSSYLIKANSLTISVSKPTTCPFKGGNSISSLLCLIMILILCQSHCLQGIHEKCYILIMLYDALSAVSIKKLFKKSELIMVLNVIDFYMKHFYKTSIFF